MTKECAECLEQARLLGMSGQREAKLQADLADARQLLGVYRVQRDYAERKVEHLEKTCKHFGVVPAKMPEELEGR